MKQSTWFMNEERWLTFHLAGIFFLIIGTFWLLGSLQEPLFYHCVGQAYHPQVNIISFLVMMPIMFGYMSLASRFSLAKLCLVITALYGVFFAGGSALLMHPTIGLANAVASADRYIGWALYAVIKTYGVVMVALFWSYATSVSSVETAKSRFPLVMLAAQGGSFLASTFVRIGSGCGISFLMWCATAGIACIVVWFYILYRAHIAPDAVDKTPSPGLLDGLLAIIERPYLRSVLVVSVFYVIITAFVDYHMHYLAHIQYPYIDDFAWFKGVYGQAVNGLSFLMTLLATRRLLDFLGVSGCLLLYPALVAVGVVAAWMFPSLWPVFAVLVVMRALAFALHNPVKEIIYIPESSVVRVKAKGWIDIVGYRAAFTLGSYATLFIQHPYETFVQASAVVSLLLIVVWWYHARRVSSHFTRES